MLIEEASDRILGFLAFGAEASELMATVQTAMLGHLPFTVLRDALFTHPTAAEGLTVLLADVVSREPTRRPASRPGRRCRLAKMGPSSAGDAISQDHRIIEIRVAELRQLFNAIDPSPFRERDLDPESNNSSSNGAPIFPPTHRWLWSFTWSGRRAPRTRRVFSGKRCRVFGQRAIATRRRPSRSVSTRPHQPCDCPGLFGDLNRHWRCDRGLFHESRLAEVIREGFLIGGWVPCGGRSRCSCTTGGRSALRRVSSIA